MPKERLGYNFQIPRKQICHDNFNSILTNFNGQGENNVNNSDFIETNVNSPDNNLNKILDNAQRYSEIKISQKKSKSDLLDLIIVRKENLNNPNIAYLNINTLIEKIISLREICRKSSIDILCVDEIKLDASYLNAQFHIEGCQFSTFRRDRNKHRGGRIVFARSGIITKTLESLDGKENETICIEVTISKKKRCIKFAYRPLEKTTK